MAEASRFSDFTLWRDNEPFIVCLQIKNLDTLQLKLTARGIEYVSFFEPDLDKLTSIAFFDGPKSKVVHSLSLAGNGETR